MISEKFSALCLIEIYRMIQGTKLVYKIENSMTGAQKENLKQNSNYYS